MVDNRIFSWNTLIMKLERLNDYSKLTGPAPEDLPKDIQITEVCPGLKVWRNPINKFCVARLHYSANPAKRSKEWRDTNRAGYTWAEWMREYEIIWSSFAGVPVYIDDYSREFHVSTEPLVWAKDYPIMRGWDFGLAANGMACVFAQLLTNFRLFVYKELTASDTDLENFAPAVKAKSLEWFPGCTKFIDIVDPSGFNRGQLDKRTCVDIVKKVMKTKPVPGEKGMVARRKAVVDFLGSVKGLPKTMIDLAGCPMLIEGFDGGYHYGYARDGQLKDEAEKNEYSHVHDAHQMVCSRAMVLDLNSREKITISTPSYSFGR